MSAAPARKTPVSYTHLDVYKRQDSVSGWSTGSALAAQIKDLRQQAAGGWALYRYGLSLIHI